MRFRQTSFMIMSEINDINKSEIDVIIKSFVEIALNRKRSIRSNQELN